jgi:hypothetical protein
MMWTIVPRRGIVADAIAAATHRYEHTIVHIKAEAILSALLQGGLVLREPGGQIELCERA